MGSWRSTLFRALRAHYERVHPGIRSESFSLSLTLRKHRRLAVDSLTAFQD